MSEWSFYARSTFKAIFRVRTYSRIQSGDDDYEINETGRKPTTGTRCPTRFAKLHGIFYMPSRTDTTEHTKAFDFEICLWNGPN